MNKEVPGGRRIRLHSCTICGNVGEWGPTWQWKGSWRDLDEDRPVVKVCCDECKEEAERRRKSGK